MPNDTPQEYIYEIIVRNYPDNRTEVTKCIDPLFDAKLLLEGVGVLVKEIVKWSALHPEGVKKERWDITQENVIKLLREYLDITTHDYKEP